MVELVFGLALSIVLMGAAAMNFGTSFWLEAVGRKPLGECGRRHVAGGEGDFRRRGSRCAWRPVAQQFGDTAGNRQGRVEPVDRPGRDSLEACDEQRVVRAGEHYGVCAPPLGVDEATSDFFLDSIVTDRRAGELGFRK